MTKIFLSLFNIGITAGWLILAVLILRVLLRKAPKWTICLLWAVVALRLVFPFSIESVFSLIPSAQTIPVEIERMEEPVIHTGINYVDERVNPVIVSQMAPKTEASVNPMQVLTLVASIVWIVGLILFQAYTIVSYVELRRKVRIAVPLRQYAPELFETTERTNDKKVYVCDRIKSPFILGIVRPKIYLPTEMEETAYRNILKHEETHLKRGDQFWKPLGYLLMSVYWFQPLCWVAYHFFCKDMELACDERATAGMHKQEKAGYCETLLACSTNRKILAACPVAFGEVGVKERVKHVIHYRKPAFWIVLAACVGCVVAAVCFLTNPKSENDAAEGIETVGTEAAEETGTENAETVSGTENEEVDITRISDSVYEKSFGEIDGNRVSVQVEQPYEEEGTDYDSHQKLFWNGTMIWEYSEVNYVDPSSVEYLDLDEDGEKEIFYTFAPRVNSAGLVEYVVLKQNGGGWHPLQMQQEGNLAENNFPVSVIYQGNYKVEISCEGTDKTIYYEVKEHYERMLEDEIETAKEQGFTDVQVSMYQPYLDDTVAAAGEEYGCLSAWGMWDIKPAVYDNEAKNCLVATYGIQGLEGKFDFFGYLDVYFNYDRRGNYQILDLQFSEYYPVKSGASSYEEVIDEYRDMVQNRFYLDVLNTDDREKSFGPDIGLEIRMRVQNVFYALYDIDGNGTEELIIAAGEQGVGVESPDFKPKNYDLYTYRDGKVVHVFSDYEFGYRTNFELCENGRIEVTSSGSAAESTVTFFRIGADGASPVVIDNFACIGEKIDDKTVVFQHYMNGRKITEEEYNRRIEEYAKPFEGLEWQEIY